MKKYSRIYKAFLYGLTLFIIATAAVVGYEVENRNFHAITPGEAYRSAQLDRAELAYYIRKYEIRSIVNLRGKAMGEAWYTNEVDFSSKNRVAHYDVALSAYQEPNEKDVESLMEIFTQAPRPLLIHCQAGADRSGLVAAMWKVVVDKEPKAEATRQLSIFYGHLMIGKTAAMDNFFQKWDPPSKMVTVLGNRPG